MRKSKFSPQQIAKILKSFDTGKIISFFYPLTRKIKSNYSGYLELTQVNGKTLLDTVNTNYSYGSLQRILHFSLLQIDLSKVENILVLGLEEGSVVKTLRNEFKFSGNITAVDIDPVIILTRSQIIHKTE